MMRLTSIIAGCVAVALLLCLPGCMSSPLREASQALRHAASFRGGGGSESSRLSGQLSLARLSERGGQYDQARNLYARYLLQKPNDPLPYHRLAVIAAREEQYDKAEEYFQKARSMAPPSSKLLSDFGYLYYMQDRFAEAEELLRLAVAEAPDDDAANNNLGLLLGEQGRFAESFEAFQRAVSPAEAHANLAFVMAQVGEHQRALEHYSQALTLQEDLRPAAEAMVHLAEQRKAVGIAGAGRPEDGGPSPQDANIRLALDEETLPANQHAGPTRLAHRPLDQSAVAATGPAGLDQPDRKRPASSTPPEHSSATIPGGTVQGPAAASVTHQPSEVTTVNYFEAHTAAPVVAAPPTAPPPSPRNETSTADANLRWQVEPAEQPNPVGSASTSNALFRRLLAPPDEYPLLIQ
jgi:Tfp pilus assembly protein PilF